jgi:hypothetical protein
MPRQARVVAVGVPHHITHRGNNRQDVPGRAGTLSELRPECRP